MVAYRDDPGMRMKRSAVEIRCLDDGFELVLPADDEETAALALDAVQEFDAVNENRILIAQAARDGVLIDTEDRVQVCISLVRALHEAGL